MAHILICWLFIAAVYLLLVWRLMQIISPDKSKYLDVVSYEWKCGRDIRTELNKRHKGIIFSFAFHHTMRILIQEDLIECRPVKSFLEPSEEKLHGRA